MDRERRRFLKAAGKLGLLGAGLGLVSKRALANTGLALADLEAAGYAGVPALLDYVVLGPCGFWGVIVGHNLPVAIVELTETPYDSIFLNSAKHSLFGQESFQTASGPKFFMSERYQAHVWGITDDVREIMLAGVDCVLCKDSEADAAGQSDMQPAEGVETYSGLVAEKVSGNFACSIVGGQLAKKMTAWGSSVAGSEMPLLYASEFDPQDWAFACNDLAVGLALSPFEPALCGVSGLVLTGGQGVGAATKALGSGASKAGSTFGSFMGQSNGAAASNNAFFSSLGNLGQSLESAMDSMGVGDICVGTWGPLYPRNAQVMGTADSVGAAMTAYRALRMAHTTFHTLKPMVDEKCYMQPFYPKVVPDGFHPGAAAAVVDAMMARSGFTTIDGRTAFILWSPVACCLTWAQLATCS